MSEYDVFSQIEEFRKRNDHIIQLKADLHKSLVNGFVKFFAENRTTQVTLTEPLVFEDEITKERIKVAKVIINSIFDVYTETPLDKGVYHQIPLYRYSIEFLIRLYRQVYFDFSLGKNKE